MGKTVTIMRTFNRFFAAVTAVLVLLFAAANVILWTDGPGSGKPWRVEINRLALQLETEGSGLILTVNAILGAMAVLVISVMLYVASAVLAPFERLADVPYELSKGNLTVPVKETKSRFFGRFIWGVDMLREYIEQQKKRELDLQRDKKPFCSPFPTI